jgi:DNA polymerase-1
MLATHYDTFQRPYLEADDVMGILSTSNIIKGKKIIVSEDKDMKTIPGWLFNPRKDAEEANLISAEEADYWFYYQTLVGDSTDNYKGCPGIGPVKAEKILMEESSWDAVLYTYLCKGLTEQDAITQARVARICRASDYDFTHKQPIPWRPKNERWHD